MNLYLLTNKIGDFYCIAKTPNDAQNFLEKQLMDSDYGFSVDRVTTNIKLLAREVPSSFSNKNKLSFRENMNLLFCFPPRSIESMGGKII